VESVAWVAERKNVLSAFFCFTAMLSYAYYLENPRGYKYCFVILLFSLGLMAKPILVTFPFLLLLFDYWPLYRLNSWGDLYRLLFEKIPFFLLAFVMSVVTFLATRHEGAVISLDVLPVWDRIANALISYLKYLGKVFWPENLAVFYPLVRIFSSFQIIGAALILIGISCFVIVLSKRYRYAMVGWFWYLGILVPVIGFVQAGEQAMADRYTYIPAIGLFIMTAWGVPDLFKRWWPKQKVVYMAFTGAILPIFIICTFYQVKYWHNSITLFEHALQVTHGNYLAHNNLGVALLNEGRLDEAEKHFEMAIEIKPDYSAAYNNMGLVLASLGKLHEAVSRYNKALKINQNDGKAHDNLGIAFANMGRFDEAMKHFQEALRINPENADAYNNMGSLLARQGKVNEALGYFERSLQLDGDHAMANNNMGVALANLGRLDEAADHFAKALSISPDNRDAYNNLIAVLKKINNTKKTSAYP
jgi:protein O-mannosyl-transferase